MQVSVGRSSAEILQDLSAGRRQLERGEKRPALLLTGRLHHNVPVDAEIRVSSKRLVVMLARVTVARAVSHAVLQKPVQT